MLDSVFRAEALECEHVFKIPVFLPEQEKKKNPPKHLCKGEWLYAVPARIEPDSLYCRQSGIVQGGGHS